jgi:hypothetical protein
MMQANLISYMTHNKKSWKKEICNDEKNFNQVTSSITVLTINADLDSY